MNLYKTKTAGIALLAVLLLSGAPAPLAIAQGNQDLNLSYQRPPQAIADIIDAPATPSVSINTKGDLMLLLERPGYPSIEELAQPESRLGGLRINPATNGQSRASFVSNIKLKQVKGGEETQLKGLPQNARLSYITWSPDEKYIAFTNTVANGIELWIADISTKQAKKLTEAKINDAYSGSPFSWTSDSKTLVVKFVDEKRGEMPITSRGSKGINSDSKALGTSGQNGGNLDITLHFDQLGSLTIDTQGAEVEMARRAETEQKVLMHVLKNDQ